MLALAHPRTAPTHISPARRRFALRMALQVPLRAAWQAALSATTQVIVHVIVRVTSVLLVVAAASHPVDAQELEPKRNPAAPEFTRQSVLIVNFTPRAGADVKLGKRIADDVRSRVARLLVKRDADVVKGYAIATAMSESDLNPDSTFSPTAFRAMGSVFRADEYLQAYVATDSSGIRAWGDLVLSRDERLRQPLPTVRAASVDSVSQLFALAIIAARAQLVPQRRCENALSSGQATRAEAAARAGVAAYPRSTIARTCLTWSMRQLHVPPKELLHVAQEILAIDSTSAHAMEAAAIALDGLEQNENAAAMWLRLAATDSNNLDLTLRVARALNDGHNSIRAERFANALASAHPNDLRITQQQWRAAFDNRHWVRAVATGERLMARDPQARTDSTFHLRLGIVYRESKLPFKAVELLAHAVTTFPADARLYALYTQLVKAEADTALARGLMQFPKNIDLLAMKAQELRAIGKLAESLAATKLAMTIDSSIPRGHLVVAQLELDLGHPDSALISLRRATAMDNDTSAIAQFALAKGNALFRAAGTTQSPSEYRIAYEFLSFSDTVLHTTQAQFLSGAAALGVARTTLNAAEKTLAQRSGKLESCRIVRGAADMLPAARTGLNAGLAAYTDMAKQSLEYLDKLGPYYEDRLKLFCGSTSNP